MVHYSMRFQIPESMPPKLARTRFFWARDSARDSFVSTLLPRHQALGPRLGALGPVADANIDLVRLAVMVYAADRSTLRRVGATNWSRRELSLEVPVSDPYRWEPLQVQLQSLLGFLSGDSWTLGFRKARAPKEQTGENRFAGAQRVVLLSGGADSAVGALLSRRELRDAHHILLFLAFGLAIASIEALPLWIPENGFASLNLPLTADQRGSLSTRTTHPLFLEQLAALATAVGAHAQIENPLAGMTKGEMFAQVAQLVGKDTASDFLSATHSCGHTGHRAFHLSPLQHCGVCFGCLLRRASFLAAHLKDQTDYLFARTTNRPDAYLRSKSMEPSLRAFVARGLRTTDLASLTLPSTYGTAAARDICQRAIAELELLFP